jgi:addiction module HigA family antidote
MLDYATVLRDLASPPGNRLEALKGRLDGFHSVRINDQEFLTPLGMTRRRLADHLEHDVKVVNRIVNGRTSVTAEMALKLGAAFRTTPELAQRAESRGPPSSVPPSPKSAETPASSGLSRPTRASP